MKKVYLLVVAILGSIIHIGQDVHQVVFLNEGYYDYFEQTQVVEPSIGIYNPETEVYQEVATISDARFGSDVLVHDELIYVAADTRLLIFDANSYDLLAETEVIGVRSLAVWQDQLIITRGEVEALDSYLQVRNAITLDLIYELENNDGPAYPSQDIIIVEDEAFIAVNNGFTWGAEVGIIGILDLENQTYGNEIDLGENGTNPDNLMMADGRIYTLNNRDFSGSSVSVVDIEQASFVSTTDVALNSGCASSLLVEGHVHFVEYGVDKVARFDVSTEEVADTVEASQAYYGMAIDPVSGLIYATTTDYVSTGTAYVLDTDYNELQMFEVGVAAGSIAFDLREATSIESNTQADFSVYPNPCHDQLVINTADEMFNYRILDIQGRTVTSGMATNVLTLDTEFWLSGVYVLELHNSDGQVSQKKIIRN